MIRTSLEEEAPILSFMQGPEQYTTTVLASVHRVHVLI